MTTPNRRNSDFQILNFIIGACHTPDAAYAQMCNLRDERELAIEAASTSPPPPEGSVAERVFLAGLRAAEKELNTINKAIAAIQPKRKYAHLPDDEAHEACQHDEWRLELIRRAENHLLTSGSIPADQFAAMRLHPDFTALIAPAIEQLSKAITEQRPLSELVPPAARYLQLGDNT